MPRRKKKNRKINILLIIASAFVLFLIFFSTYIYLKLNAEFPAEKEIFFTVPKGADYRLIVQKMNEEGYFKPRWLYNWTFKIISKLTGKNIIAGNYRISPKLSNIEIVKSFFSGSQLYIIKVTYPEGITLAQFASITARKLGTDSADFIQKACNKELLKKYQIPIDTPEGYLMPSTYNFYWQQPNEEVIEKLLSEHDRIWKQKFEQKARIKGMSKHEILTLASIIEAETPVKEEKKTVSGLYYNRLRLGMKLESDPTVQYALNKRTRLTYKDLKFEHPYNTYIINGLPPGPINSPSLSSIESAIEPEKNDYLYFVAIGDGSGRHNFSRTFEEHQKFVKKYKRMRNSVLLNNY